MKKGKHTKKIDSAKVESREIVETKKGPCGIEYSAKSQHDGEKRVTKNYRTRKMKFVWIVQKMLWIIFRGFKDSNPLY